MREHPIIFFSRDVWDYDLDSRGSSQPFGLGQVGDKLGITFLIWKPGLKQIEKQITKLTSIMSLSG